MQQRCNDCRLVPAGQCMQNKRLCRGIGVLWQVLPRGNIEQQSPVTLSTMLLFVELHLGAVAATPRNIRQTCLA
jgi:hypothetical protein